MKLSYIVHTMADFEKCIFVKKTLNAAKSTVEHDILIERRKKSVVKRQSIRNFFTNLEENVKTLE